MARIDWNAPLETDEETPRAIACATPFGEDRYVVTLMDDTPLVVFSDGRGGAAPWFDKISVRNVRPATAAEGPLQRMERLVRKLGSCGGNEAYIVEAREIVALLPAPPVDPDLIEARRLAVDWLNNLTSNGLAHEAAAKIEAGQGDDNTHVVHMLRGIKRGRELAGGESL